MKPYLIQPEDGPGRWINLEDIATISSLQEYEHAPGPFTLSRIEFFVTLKFVSEVISFALLDETIDPGEYGPDGIIRTREMVRLHPSEERKQRFRRVYENLVEAWKNGADV